MIKHSIKKLICIDCKSEMNKERDFFVCSNCSLKYELRNNILFAIKQELAEFDNGNNDSIINKLKIYFKKYYKLFSFFYYVFGAIFVGKSAKSFVKNINSDRLILNLGSGIKKVDSHVLNIDFYPFIGVDMVADIANLPFPDNSVGAVVCEFTLEHTVDPNGIAREIQRILQPGGTVYIATPFMEGYHSSPYDYCRWSKQGLKKLMSEFEEAEMGIRSGPASALVAILQEWLAVLFCFGSKKLQQMLVIFFMIILSPLKLFDYIMYKMPNAENIAFAFYFIGYKK